MTEEYQADNYYSDELEDMVEQNKRQIRPDDLTEHQNLVEAHRALIERYFVDASQNVFYSVHSHQQLLQAWHEENTMWHLEKYQGVFHLQCVPSNLPPEQNNYNLSHPYDFAYLFWILWYAAEGHDRHYTHTQYFSLQDLLTQIKEQWQITGKYTILQLDTLRSNRQSLVRALKYLIQDQYLTLVHGQPETWIETKENDDQIFYCFSDLTALLIASFQFNAVGLIKTRVRHLHQEIQPASLYELSTPDKPMRRAWRNLLLGPIFLRYDDPEAFSHLRKNAAAVEKNLSYNFGWLLEVNGEYACIVHPSANKAKNVITFKLSNPLDQLILLFCGALRNHITNRILSCNAFGCILTSYEEFNNLFLPVYKDFTAHSIIQTAKKTAKQYFEDVCCKMRQITLIRGPDAAGQVLILPTAASYAPTYTQEMVKPEPKTELAKPSTVEYIQNTMLWIQDQEPDN